MHRGGGAGSGPPLGGSDGGGGGNGGRDRISGLPDDMCHWILSFLKAREAVRTSALSRRWRSLWATAPCLDIRHPCGCDDARRADQGRDGEFVKNLLLRRLALKAPLDTLRLSWSHGGDSNTWIAYAVRHEARVIELSVGKNHSVRPELEYTSFISDEPGKLKILKLTNVTLGERTLRQICSSFEEVELKNCNILGVVIQTALLKRFTMINCFTPSVLLVDAAPNLVLLRCIKPYAAVPQIKNSESLVTATIVLDDSRLRSGPGFECPPRDDDDNDGSDDDHAGARTEDSHGSNNRECDPKYDDNDYYYDSNFSGCGDKKGDDLEEYDGSTVNYGKIADECSSNDGNDGSSHDGDEYDGRNDGTIYTGRGILDSLSNVRTMDLMAHPGEVVLRRELKNKCSVFRNLKTLSLGEWCIAPEFDALSTILEHSPNLEKLFLHLDMDHASRGGINPNGRSFASNLKEVNITCSKNDTMVHKLAKFFLANGIPVEKISVRRIATTRDLKGGKVSGAERKAQGETAESSAKHRKEERRKKRLRVDAQDVVAEGWESMVECMRSRFRMLSVCRTSIHDIHSEIIFSVFLRLPGNFHRIRMSYACKEWRNIFQNYFHLIPAELPWLLMPSSTRPLFHTTVGSMTYILHLPPLIMEHARFCGSQEGGWVVLAMENTRKCILYNLNNQETINTPSTMIVEETGEVRQVQVVAAVPSGCPTRDGKCLVLAAIVKDSSERIAMAYWQHGRANWVHVMFPQNRNNEDMDILDILYHTQRMSFIFLTADLNVHVLKPVFQANAEVRMDYEDLEVVGCHINFRLMMSGSIPRRQYLAQSENDILRIVRYPRGADRTRRLIIHRLDLSAEMDTMDEEGVDEEEEEDEDEEEEDDEDEEEEDDEPRASWSRPYMLLGRTVFAGKACSRVFERDDIFSDHTMFFDDRKVKVPLLNMPNLFDRSDMGMFSVEQSNVLP